MCVRRVILGAVVLSVVATITNRATPQQATLDLQEKCSRQAQIAFDKMNFKEVDRASFINHYNVKLNRCLIETEQDLVQFLDTFWNYKIVSDAYEGTVFASYSWHSDRVKKYWEMPPVECKVTLPSGDDELCKSSEEFDKMVKVYMQ